MGFPLSPKKTFGLFGDALDFLIPKPSFPSFDEQDEDIPNAPATPEETLQFLGSPEGLRARQFSQRSSVARQLGLPTSGLNIPRS